MQHILHLNIKCRPRISTVSPANERKMVLHSSQLSDYNNSLHISTSLIAAESLKDALSLFASTLRESDKSSPALSPTPPAVPTTIENVRMVSFQRQSPPDVSAIETSRMVLSQRQPHRFNRNGNVHTTTSTPKPADPNKFAQNKSPQEDRRSKVEHPPPVFVECHCGSTHWCPCASQNKVEDEEFDNQPTERSTDSMKRPTNADDAVSRKRSKHEKSDYCDGKCGRVHLDLPNQVDQQHPCLCESQKDETIGTGIVRTYPLRSRMKVMNPTTSVESTDVSAPLVTYSISSMAYDGQPSRSNTERTELSSNQLERVISIEVKVNGEKIKPIRLS